MVSQIYSSELQLNTANDSDTKACTCPFLKILFLSEFMINGTILILKLSVFLFFDGDIPRSASYGVYISQLIRFARASSHVANFNTRNK